MTRRIPKPDADALNARQARFVDEYLVDLNAKQAAIRAGYSPKTAEQQGSALLSNPKVASAVQVAQGKREARTEITADRVLTEIARIAFSDSRAIFDEDGRLRPIHQLPPEAAACIASLEVVTRRIPGSDPVEVEHVSKIRTWDKGAMLALLAKHLGLTPERLQQLGANGQPVDPARPVLNIIMAAPIAAIERDEETP